MIYTSELKYVKTNNKLFMCLNVSEPEQENSDERIENTEKNIKDHVVTNKDGDQ